MDGVRRDHRGRMAGRVALITGDGGGAERSAAGIAAATPGPAAGRFGGLSSLVNVAGIRVNEIAHPILFLSSLESSFVTGVTLMVDAGKSIQ